MPLSARSGHRKRKKPTVKVKGDYSTGGSYGTDWTTINTCSKAGTITSVRRGRVLVVVRATGREVIVVPERRRGRRRTRLGAQVVSGQYSTGASFGG